MYDDTNLATSTCEAVDSMLLVCSRMKWSDICRFNIDLGDAYTVNAIRHSACADIQALAVVKVACQEEDSEPYLVVLGALPSHTGTYLC